MRATLEGLLSRKTLTFEETAGLFAAMLNGDLSDIETSAVLAAWRVRGEGRNELFAGAQALRKHATPVNIPRSARPIIDNCGTGGDGSDSFNLSTAAAIVAASAGARVAKHGNRSVSSKCGSADLLFAAGLSATLKADGAAKLLEATGFTFFFAPNFHPVLARLALVRKQLGVRTVFNLLGPLANPIAPEYQVIGVGSQAYLRPMAEAAAQLGIEKALVVHGRDGLDELSPVAPTDALLVSNQQITTLVIDPKALGVNASPNDLAGGDATHNLSLLRHILAGDSPLPGAEQGAIRGLSEAVALNAGAVLWLAGNATSLADGVALARTKISSKVAREFFNKWLQIASQLAS